MTLQDDFINKLASGKKRIDGRKFEEIRDIKIEHPNEKAAGAALVTLGKTKVMVGVKLDVGTPFSDRPGSGVLMTSAEFSPISSPDFELGPPRENNIELARVIDRGIRESGTVDLEKLCITEGEKVWMVFVDIDILDNFGNLIDAASIGAAVALNQAFFPKYENDAVVHSEKSKKKLPTKYSPISCTFVKVGDEMMVDPVIDEENASSCRLTITTRDDGHICAMQKRDSGDLTPEDIEKALDIAVERGKEIRKKLKLN